MEEKRRILIDRPPFADRHGTIRRPREKKASKIHETREAFMKRAFLLLCTLSPLVPLCGIAAAQPKPAVTVIKAGHLFDSETGRLLANQVILIRGDRIQSVGPKVPIPAGARVIDLSRSTVLPGMIDAHVHFGQSASLYVRPNLFVGKPLSEFWQQEKIGHLEPERYFRAYTCSGVTSVVDVGGASWIFGVRDLSRTNPSAPRMAVTGPLLATGPLGVDPAGIVVTVFKNEEHARQMVRSLIPYSPNLVKIWFVTSPRADQPFDWEAAERNVRAAINEAKKYGLRIAAHATGLRAAKIAVAAGADILVHSVWEDPVDDEFVNTLREKNVIYTPNVVVLESYTDTLRRRVTLDRYNLACADKGTADSFRELEGMPEDRVDAAAAKRASRWEEARERMFANLRKIHDAGVRIAAGSDAGNTMTLHGVSLARELELMHQAGMSNAEVLISATRTAAEVFGSDDLGTIEPGRYADLIAVDGNPLADISVMKKVRFVMKGGMVLKEEEKPARQP